MKSLLIVFTIGVTLLAETSFVRGDESADNAALVKQLFEVVAECHKSYPNVTDARIRLMLRHETIPYNQDERCMAGCALTKSGLVTDGRINVENWKKISNAKWHDKEMAMKAGKTAEYCYDRVPPSDNGCEVGQTVMTCIYLRMKMTGVSPPDIPQ